MYTAGGSSSTKEQSSRSFTLSDYNDPVTLVQGSEDNIKGYTDLLKSLNQKSQTVDSLENEIIKKVREKGYFFHLHRCTGGPNFNFY